MFMSTVWQNTRRTELWLHPLLISELNGVEGSNSRPGRFTCEKNPDVRGILCCVAPRDGVVVFEKRNIFYPCRDSSAGLSTLYRSYLLEYAIGFC